MRIFIKRMTGSIRTFIPLREIRSPVLLQSTSAANLPATLERKWTATLPSPFSKRLAVIASLLLLFIFTDNGACKQHDQRHHCPGSRLELHQAMWLPFQAGRGQHPPRPQRT